MDDNTPQQCALIPMVKNVLCPAMHRKVCRYTKFLMLSYILNFVLSFVTHMCVVESPLTQGTVYSTR